ncbi:MAG: peptide chain release factor N(5)-glutamine methyltransferase [Defluviitaleaceae bacterium]|nr:peptide chain release factor N(5)-glutamine methyltransferase [Defluviitaleaceae bacterium]
MNNRNLRDLLRYATDTLRLSGIESAALDAQLLAAYVLKQGRVYVLTHPELELTTEQADRFHSLITRRCQHEPVAYLTGTCEFMALDFTVNEHTLIPRADTETLVEAAIAHIRRHNCQRILEIGTGSGCISVSIAVNCLNTRITAVDISSNALSVAVANAANHNVGSRVCFIQGDIFNNSLAKELSGFGSFDIIISNPPYITAEEMRTLPPNVHRFEPHTALFGGNDGLAFYKEIARRSPSLLAASGIALLEIGCTQAKATQDIFQKYGFTHTTILQDLASKDRVLSASIGDLRTEDTSLVSPA